MNIFIASCIAPYFGNKNSLFAEQRAGLAKQLVVASNQIHISIMVCHNSNLAGKLLVAMPGMGDPRFTHSVVYIGTHSEDGAMGLIINKPNPKLELKTLLGYLDIPTGPSTPNISVHFGGPVEQSRGFLLHSGEYMSDPDTVMINTDFAITATIEILRDLSQGSGPNTSLLALGYSGWAAGQLEAELLANGWLICDASFEIVFGLADADKWAKALGSLGIDPTMLSSQSGRA